MWLFLISLCIMWLGKMCLGEWVMCIFDRLMFVVCNFLVIIFVVFIGEVDLSKMRLLGLMKGVIVLVVFFM